MTAQHKHADVPSLAFVHIPPPEFMIAWNDGNVRGSKSEPVNCPSGDSGLVQALKAVNVSAVFSGHDHDNNFDAMHSSGIRFAYGHKTGGACPQTLSACSTWKALLHNRLLSLLKGQRLPAESCQH